MHLKRRAMPRSWPLPRKGKSYVTKGRGPAPLIMSIPLLVVLRDMLKVLNTKSEAKKVLQEKGILIDNRVIKDESFRVGLFDRLYLKRLDKLFTVEIRRKRLEVVELSKEELYKKPAKVIGKKSLKGGKIQLNLYDGKNLILEEKKAKQIAVGDSVVLNLKENKIEKCLKLEKGALVVIIKGKHCGEKGKIASIDKEVVVKNEKELRTDKQNVFVVEK